MRLLSSGFLNDSVSSVSLSIPLGPFQIFTKTCRDIFNSVLIAGVNNTGDKMFTSVSSIDNKLSPVSLLPAINYCRCR